MGQVPLHLLQMRPQLGKIRLDIDRYGPCPPGFDIQDPDVPAQLIDDVAPALAGAPHIEILVPGELLHLTCVRVIGVYVQNTVPVGAEVDGIVDPHGDAVGPGKIREVDLFLGGEIVEVDLLGQAALVALPGAVLPGDAVVGDLRSVRGKAAACGLVHDELLQARPIG